jgi:hypothetical protein
MVSNMPPAAVQQIPDVYVGTQVGASKPATADCKFVGNIETGHDMA